MKYILVAAFAAVLFASQSSFAGFIPPPNQKFSATRAADLNSPSDHCDELGAPGDEILAEATRAAMEQCYREYADICRVYEASFTIKYTLYTEHDHDFPREHRQCHVTVTVGQ